jgi:exopolysaccharide production protein ExoZ
MSAGWVIEGWRGLAACMVVFAHYGVVPGSSWGVLRFTFTGVDLFFVLSGFVFAPYFFGKPLAWAGFALRRFFRIYPAYFLALLAYFFLKVMAGQPLEFVWQHLTFLHLQSREMAFYYNPVLWSLPSEVEFYVLLPLMAWACQARPVVFVALVGAALVLRVAVGWASDAQSENGAFIWMHHLPGLLIEFLLGVGAWRVAGLGLSRRSSAIIFIAGLAFWTGLAVLFSLHGDVGIDASVARGQLSWLAALGFACMVAATARPWAGAPQGLVRVAEWAGRLSFGVYLFHTGALAVLAPYPALFGPVPVALVALALTGALAWLSYVFWENPWRQFGRAWAARQNTSVSPG